MRNVLLVAAMALGMGTAANAQSFDANRQLDRFTRSAFLATLDQLGATHEESEDAPNISIEFANGLIADGLLMACKDQDTSTDCLGTSMLATFSRPDGASDADIFAAVNKYNYLKNFGRAYVAPDGEISLRMYIIADGKITMENYRRQIQLWAGSVEDFSGYLYD